MTDPRRARPAPSPALLVCDALLLAALLTASMPDQLVGQRLREQLDALLVEALLAAASTPDDLVAQRLRQHKARMRAADPNYIG